MQLGDIQRKFKDLMLQPLSALEASEHEFAKLFDEGKIPLSERLKVYHNNIVGSISEALCATFPLLNNLVGEDFLKSMAREFTFKNPPSQGCIHHYGAGFDEFISGYEPAKSLPYLPDVARFELAMNDAYYARDDNAMIGNDLAQIPPDNLEGVVLSLRLSARLIQSKYPLIQIRDFCMDENNIDPPDLSKDQPCDIMIYRPELEVQIVPLEEAEYKMLGLLQKNITMGDALETTSEKFSDFNFQEFLQKHIALETFASLQPNV